MARIARLVVPGLAHHVTQRGNRRERGFFTEDDYRAYLDLLKAYLPKSGTRLLAWCLMPNHVHLLAVPDGPDGLRALLGEVHRRYTAGINARNGWTGHLWQGRFGSVVMEEYHFVHAVRYVCLNPVRAKLAPRAEDWPWASTRAHLSGHDDGLTDLAPVRDLRRPARQRRGRSRGRGAAPEREERASARLRGLACRAGSDDGARPGPTQAGTTAGVE
ncbi:transposase [Labrys wisconsinensis]|uniref:Transposase n=1 Tax=Labrys wisconsinensis TaxID=425677 RepID=A0ABU0JIQ7_9HYPH|nr:transposase [Labrys wisconsinensis]MDQ0473505.1 putative transposase [Labrys wisconsinensis]